ncbi:hypothetical protein NDU88_002060 [Pleurodeles waltl]|uniref:Uncharacterized protein n=1 Tax=Pleurodeles waltl TaxID=8319 RepID=A0AAV7KXV0_PLEWA|nr:hypothetical protein NDU88_002060 [Pleurodeles waltl]
MVCVVLRSSPRVGVHRLSRPLVKKSPLRFGAQLLPVPIPPLRARSSTDNKAAHKDANTSETAPRTDAATQPVSLNHKADQHSCVRFPHFLERVNRHTPPRS